MLATGIFVLLAAGMAGFEAVSVPGSDWGWKSPLKNALFNGFLWDVNGNNLLNGFLFDSYPVGN
jgi:hypothetical protein